MICPTFRLEHHRPSQTSTNPQHCQRGCRSSARCVASQSAPPWDVIVLGAGAAGLTAGAHAAEGGARTLILEGNAEAGRKILVSGGTRCNVCPGTLDQQRDFTTESSQSALRAILKSWTLPACLAWLEEEIGLPLAFDEPTEKWFPVSNSAREVRDRLLQAARHAGCYFAYHKRIQDIISTEGFWQCTCGDGSTHSAARLIMATGGLSFPSLGASGRGLSLLAKHGHALHEPYPALTPLKGRHPGSDSSHLAGVSLYDCQLSFQSSPQPKHRARRKDDSSSSIRKAMLFTHRGFSGPAALDLSHNISRPITRGHTDFPSHMCINWVGTSQEQWEQALQPRGSASVAGALRQGGLPARLADALCRDLGLADRQVAQLRKGEKAQLLQALTAYRLECTGHEGYAKAEVTGGGVPLSEVDCATLESRLMPGVHLCGEVLDVFGRIGGYNFYWAWVTGRLAGLQAAAFSFRQPQ